MGKVEDATASFRRQNEAQHLRAIFERHMGVDRQTYEREARGELTPREAAILSVIRAVFDGGST